MTTQVNIRTFRPEDAQAVHRIFAQGLLDFAQGVEDSVWRYVQQSLNDDLADIPAHYLNEPGNHFWVAEVNGQVKGMVGIQRRSEAEAELRRMSVASDARRLGVGSQLLATTEAFCRAQGYQRIKLTTVTILHAALALYRKHGYQLVSEEHYGQISGQHYIKAL